MAVNNLWFQGMYTNEANGKVCTPPKKHHDEGVTVRVIEVKGSDVPKLQLVKDEWYSVAGGKMYQVDALFNGTIVSSRRFMSARETLDDRLGHAAESVKYLARKALVNNLQKMAAHELFPGELL